MPTSPSSSWHAAACCRKNRAFAEAGAFTALSDIDPKSLAAKTDALSGAVRKILDIVCKVADEVQVAALIAQTVATFA
jgi:hypothetical protein